VARTKGFPADEPARGIAAAEALAARILAVSPRLAEARASSALSDAFSAVTWRLSRLARLRSDTALADRLDEANTALKHLLTLIQYEHQRTFMGLTPWEGLQIALRRADFAEAMRYAPAVLRSDGSIAFDPRNSFAAAPGSIIKDAVVGRGGEGSLFVRRLALDCRAEGRRDAVVSLEIVSGNRASKGNAAEPTADGNYSKAFSSALPITTPKRSEI